MRKTQKIYSVLKRVIGLVGSLVGILFCAVFFWWWVIPINLIVTRGHPFFARLRVGKNGKDFRCLKFRTMKNDADPHVTSRQDGADRNVTKFGKFLRKTSLDETLQLFNIFLGQMSFIGPRPLIDVGEDAITIKRRKENGSIQLRPGLSGYAQIHRRGNLGPEDKANYDGEYFQHFSLWFDIKIFVFTIFRNAWINKID